MNDDDSVSLQYREITIHNNFMPQFDFFKIRQLLADHQQTTNHRLGYQIKIKKILRNFLIFKYF